MSREVKWSEPRRQEEATPDVTPAVGYPFTPLRERAENLTRREASDYLRRAHGIRCSASTLATLATRGGGPAFYRVRPVLYPLAALDQWARERLGTPVTSTSDEVL